MKKKQIEIRYEDLLKIISALQTEAKSFADVKMDKEAQEFRKLRKRFKNVEKKRSYQPMILSY